MSILAQEEQGGSAVRRIGQEVQKSAHERYVLEVHWLDYVCMHWADDINPVVHITEVMMPVR